MNLGLTDINRKPISKTAFKKLADIHTYSSRVETLKIWYFRSGNYANKIIYGFYPEQDTAKNNLDDCYAIYMSTLKGYMHQYEAMNLQFGNCGIPIAYGNLKTR